LSELAIRVLAHWARETLLGVTVSLQSAEVGNPDRASGVQGTPDAALADGEQDAARLGASPQFPRPVHVEKQQRGGGDNVLCGCYGTCRSQSVRCTLKVRMCVCARMQAMLTLVPSPVHPLLRLLFLA